MLMPAYLIAAASTGLALGDEVKPKKLQMRDPVTHESLARAIQAENNRDPMVEIKPSDAPDPSKNSVPTSILERSDILSFNGLTTLIPKRAILTLPESLKARVGTHGQGHRLVNWSEFLVANRGWITTLEVSRAQVEGNAALPIEAGERINKSSSLIVATFQGGPISVLPEKKPEPESEISTEE